MLGIEQGDPLLYVNTGKENRNYRDYRVYIGVIFGLYYPPTMESMENQMEKTMDNEMETGIM